MSGFSAIELSQLPAPDVVETLSFESILEDMKFDLLSRDAGLEAVLQLESEPVVKLLEVCAYRELILRQRVNDATRAVMLSSALGSDLDNLAALFGVQRQIITEGDADAIPPVLPIMEDDERLRRRVQLSLEGHSTAGPEGSYVFWGLSASPDVKDIDVQSPTPGDVLVTVLSNQGDGTPTQQLLQQVDEVLNSDDVRPLTDRVTVAAANIQVYNLNASLTLYDGPDAEVVREIAEKTVKAYIDDNHRLGHDITLSGLYAALHQPGVQKVHLTEPAADLTIDASSAAWCNSVSVVIGGRDE